MKLTADFDAQAAGLNPGMMLTVPGIPFSIALPLPMPTPWSMPTAAVIMRLSAEQKAELRQDGAVMVPLLCVLWCNERGIAKHRHSVLLRMWTGD